MPKSNKARTEFIVTTAEMATILGVTSVRVGEYVREGMPKKSRGQFNVAECVQWRIARHDERVRDKPLDRAKLRESDARTTKHNLEIEHLRGRLIDTNAAAMVIQETAAAAADELENVAGRLIAAPEIKEKVLHECRAARTRLSKRVGDILKSVRNHRPSVEDNSAAA